LGAASPADGNTAGDVKAVAKCYSGHKTNTSDFCQSPAKLIESESLLIATTRSISTRTATTRSISTRSATTT